MITLKRTWWHPQEGPVDLPSDTYLPGIPRYVSITRSRHAVTQNEKLRNVPLVMSLGTYNTRKTKCPSLRERFEDDGLIPIIRPRPYRALMKRNRQRKPKPLPPMTIRVELFPPVKMAKREVVYDHRPTNPVKFCHEKVKGWLGKS